MNYRRIIIFIALLFITIDVFANNKIYNIDIDVYIDKEAVATITETWHVKGYDGTEWYKALRDLGDSTLSDFKVSMDGIPLKEKPWIVSDSLENKKGYYGINYSGADTELCFGKYDYNEHTFILEYKLDNYIFNTNDAQVLYWTYISRLQNVDFQNMSVTIRSYYSFPDTLDVWGYGYKGYAYVKDGVISLSNEENTIMTGSYVVALVKFPQETFITDYFVDDFSSFDDVHNKAEFGSFKYDYVITESDTVDDIVSFGIFGTYIAVILGIIGLVSYSAYTSGYGYINNKKIKKKETLPFRDIPCNKNIYYANALVALNFFQYSDMNIMGAIILKWLREGRITIDVNQKVQTINLDAKLDLPFTNESEKKLFVMMHEASENGILDTKGFKKWAQKHYSKFLNLFREIKQNEINRLKVEQHIRNRFDKKECKKKMVMDDTIYEDSKKLLGLKIFLEEFSEMKNKEPIEVHLWDEYLMFASVLGIADKVAKQFKNLYPQVYEQSNFDYRYIYFINDISRTSVVAASGARSAAQSYSSGGGGFSSGGGGGGSFGGGGFSGGGSR